MTMVRVEYKFVGESEVHKVRGWDLHLKDGQMVMEHPVKEGEEIKIVPITLGWTSDFEEFSVRPCDGSINEHLAKCRQWRMTDEEVEELLR